MDGKMIALIVVVVIVAIVAFIIGVYNKLITLRTRVEEAWSDIAIQLKYRADLIPNLVNTVKGYAKHENETFAMVTEARAGIMSAKTVEETAAAEGQMQMALKSLFAVAESYPELKANENFLQLQEVFVSCKPNSKTPSTKSKLLAASTMLASRITTFKLLFSQRISLLICSNSTSASSSRLKTERKLKKHQK